MRFKWLAAALLMIPVPALADVTARYSAGHDTLTVEVADNGDVRAGIDGKLVIIRHAGVDYVVVNGPDGAPHVTRAEAALAKLADRPGHPTKWQAQLSSEDDATVAGYPGSVWRFGPEDERPIELVMSADPKLAPVGNAFAHAAEAFGRVINGLVGPGSDAVQDFRDLFSHGTPIRIREAGIEPRSGKVLFELQSTSMAAIDPHRFELPGPVMDTEAFFAAVRPPQPAASEPVLIEPVVPTPPKR